MARPKSKRLPLEEAFAYDPSSPSHIRRLTGDRAGSVGNLRPDGYYRFSYFGRSWLAHHLVWVLHGRQLPDGKKFVIDHIDGCKTNNSIDNLRIASKSGNAINVRQYKNASYCKRTNMWRGYFKLKGVQHCKYFKTEEEAIAYGKSMKNKLGGEYVPQ